MVDSTNLDEKKQRRPTLWCFAPSLTPESVAAGMSKINCEQLDRAWQAFCGMAEMFDVARYHLNTALENHSEGGVPWIAVAEADGGLTSADRFLDEFYFEFWALFAPPEEDWEGVKDIVSTPE